MARATYVKGRQQSRVVALAVVIAIGVNAATGYREVLGVDVSASEDSTFWLAFLRGLPKLAGINAALRWYEGLITTTVEADWQSTGIESARCRMTPGAQAVPSDMMSVPRFRTYLAQSGLHISAEKAAAHVQSIERYTKVGTMYCAKKCPLMKLTNELIRRAQSTGNEREEAQEKGA